MKIAFLSTLYTPYLFGGAEKAASLLAEAMAREGHEVCAITLHPGDREEMEELKGVRVYRLPLDNLYWPFQKEHAVPAWKKAIWHARDIWNLRAAARVGRVLDIERPDVVHSHAIAGFSVAALREVKRRNIRLVHTMHDYYLICHRSSMFRQGRPCATRCRDCALATIPRRWGAKSIDAAIPVSQYVLDRHSAQGCLEQTVAQIIPNVNRMPGAASPAEVRPSARTGPLVFGFIGRVEKPKGIEILLQACARLEGGWTLRVAGYGEPEYLKELRARYPHQQIQWVGFTNAKEFYESIDVCIVPSIWAEPQPYVVVEALDSGKSLIVSSSGGLPEMAEFARRCAVFANGDVNALTTILQQIQSDPADWRDGGFSSAETKSRFQTAEILAAHVRIYEDSPNGSEANLAPGGDEEPSRL